MGVKAFKVQLFKLLEVADEVQVEGYVIDRVQDVDAPYMRLECDEDNAWLVTDQEVTLSPYGFAGVLAKHEAEPDELPSQVSVRFMVLVPVPSVYSERDLKEDRHALGS